MPVSVTMLKIRNHKPSLPTDSEHEVEAEAKVLRKELELTRNAFKSQCSKRKALVEFFTKKISEKEAEVKAINELREKQLSRLLRALIILESRLRKEQKSIRAQLVDKDNLINTQHQELERLRKRLEPKHTKDAATETRIIEVAEKCDESLERECYAKPDLISSLGIDIGKRVEENSPTPSLNPYQGRSEFGESEGDFFSPAKSTLNVHDRSAFSPIKTVKDGKTLKESEPEAEDGKKSLPSTLLQEVRISARAGEQDEYQDNPVLQCVNQILLKDQEDFLEEQRTLRTRSMDYDGPEPGWLDTEDPSLGDDYLMESPSFGKKDDCLGDFDKPPKIPEKSLTLTDLPKGKINRVNPPLPPKPVSLSKRPEPPKKRDIKPTTVEFHNPPMVLLPPQPVRIDLSELDMKKPSLPIPILDPIDQGPDNDLYVISNSALDDDVVQHLQGRMFNGSGLDIGLSSQFLNDNVLHSRNQHSKVPNGLLHPNHKPKSRSNSNLYSASSSLITNLVRNNKGNLIKSPPKPGLVNTIKVASPVATLLTSGKAQEQVKDRSVSQMVRKFEDLGTKQSPSEEEKRKSLDDTASDKDSSVASGESTVSYDTFLEATGLSQKSIMTPSRMLSNHKSVMKPKDVKHRNKVKSAAFMEKCSPQSIGTTVKYWHEPYV